MITPHILKNRIKNLDDLELVLSSTIGTKEKACLLSDLDFNFIVYRFLDKEIILSYNQKIREDN